MCAELGAVLSWLLRSFGPLHPESPAFSFLAMCFHTAAMVDRGKKLTMASVEADIEIIAVYSRMRSLVLVTGVSPAILLLSVILAEELSVMKAIWCSTIS